jgi:hypothetical protein
VLPYPFDSDRFGRKLLAGLYGNPPVVRNRVKIIALVPGKVARWLQQ